jgi:hypothetical protein
MQIRRGRACQCWLLTAHHAYFFFKPAGLPLSLHNYADAAASAVLARVLHPAVRADGAAAAGLAAALLPAVLANRVACNCKVVMNESGVSVDVWVSGDMPLWF